MLDCGHSGQNGWYNLKVWGEHQYDDDPRFRVCADDTIKLLVLFPTMQAAFKEWERENEEDD